MRNDENGKGIGRVMEVKRKRQAGRQTDRQTKRETERGRQRQAGRCKLIALLYDFSVKALRAKQNSFSDSI